MGHYTELQVGRLLLDWKYQIPTFLTFLFDAEDRFEIPEEEWDEETHRLRIGYRTTVGQARARLEEVGYTLPFFATVVEMLDDEFNGWVEEMLGEAIAARGDYKLSDAEIDASASEYLRSYRRAPVIKGLEAMAEFFTREAARKPTSEWLARGKWTHRSKGPDLLLTDPYEMADAITAQALDLDPALWRVAPVFAEYIPSDYPEVVTLLLAIRPTGNARLLAM